MASEKLKILLVNHSDTVGGSSVVTRRLMDALCAQGVDVRMLVVHKNSDSLRVASVGSKLSRRMAFLSEHAEIFLRNGFKRDTLFRISTAKYGLSLHTHPWFKEADVVILNWINQGMLSLKEVERIASLKPTIWTMHDQWNITGVCHYTDGCYRWLTEQCRNCPLTGRGNLAHKVFEEKKRIYDNARLHFVAVSSSLANLCRQSPLMKNADISVIPNAFPIDRFPLRPKLNRSDLGLPQDKRLIVMGAARIDDPVKNLALAIELINDLDSKTWLPVFFGKMKNPSLLNALKTPYLWMGEISEHSKLQALMAHADVILSTSVWETLPGTLVEGIACGAYGVATDNGGQRDIITSPRLGTLIDIRHPVPSLNLLLSNGGLFGVDERIFRHQTMAEQFSPTAVAGAYLRLIKKILSQR